MICVQVYFFVITEDQEQAQSTLFLECLEENLKSGAAFNLVQIVCDCNTWSIEPVDFPVVMELKEVDHIADQLLISWIFKGTVQVLRNEAVCDNSNTISEPKVELLDVSQISFFEVVSELYEIVVKNLKVLRDPDETVYLDSQTQVRKGSIAQSSYSLIDLLHAVIVVLKDLEDDLSKEKGRSCQTNTCILTAVLQNRSEENPLVGFILESHFLEFVDETKASKILKLCNDTRSVTQLNDNALTTDLDLPHHLLPLCPFANLNVVNQFQLFSKAFKNTNEFFTDSIRDK